MLKAGLKIMYYSVSEVSKQLNVSKVTIYKKINKVNGLKKHVKHLKTGQCLTEEGFKILKNSLELTGGSKPLQESIPDNQHDTYSETVLIVYKQLIESMEKQISDLKDDRQKLYEQMSIKDEQISSLTRLNENTQILLRQEQQMKQLPPQSGNGKNHVFDKIKKWFSN
jgi:septal ring factor EnvC (AmiA/AmiB activator)